VILITTKVLTKQDLEKTEISVNQSIFINEIASLPDYQTVMVTVLTKHTVTSLATGDQALQTDLVDMQSGSYRSRWNNITSIQQSQFGYCFS
jgi:hypothetical protein